MAEVKARLGNVVYAIEETDGGSLAKTAIETLRARNMTCATCESLTGGKVVAALVDIPGASAVVRAGLVTYQTDTKTILADVPAEVIERFGVVSVETACAGGRHAEAAGCGHCGEYDGRRGAGRRDGGLPGRDGVRRRIDGGRHERGSGWRSLATASASARWP